MATTINDDASPSAKEMRLVISASALGTIFEWYDFFIYGTLAASGIIGKTFFPAGNETGQTLLAWAGFAVGFGFRPLGAVLFGFLGDKLGRKYTFLVTITLMGAATAGVGLVPSAAAIGFAAPAIVLLLRIAQGLALGGEYGGAAIYVAEHSPKGKAGYYTSFIQAGVAGGFILSLAVVLATKALVSEPTWLAWAWRAPFVFSLLLLGVSLWMRLKLSESPVFKAIKEAGETARNPFVESFTYPGNWQRILVALFGIAAGLTVIWYTATFSVLSFLQQSMRVDDTTAQLITGAGVLVEDALFATLDPTTRRSRTSDGRVYTLSDTVGFVRHLPHQLVEAFRSTLEEVAEADLVLHVVDGAHPDPEEQVRAVREVLTEVGAEKVPELLVVNKIDAADEGTLLRLKRFWPEAVFVSAHTGAGIDEPRAALEAKLPRPAVELLVRVPYDRGELVARVHRRGEVLAAAHEETGTLLRARVDDALAADLAPYVVTESASL